MTIGTAYTRTISPRLADCELTHLPRVSIDLAGARVRDRQHMAGAGLIVGDEA